MIAKLWRLLELILKTKSGTQITAPGTDSVPFSLSACNNHQRDRNVSLYFCCTVKYMY